MQNCQDVLIGHVYTIPDQLSERPQHHPVAITSWNALNPKAIRSILDKFLESPSSDVNGRIFG